MPFTLLQHCSDALVLSLRAAAQADVPQTMLYRAAKSAALPASPAAGLQRCILQGFLTADHAAQAASQALPAPAAAARSQLRQSAAPRPAEQSEPRPGSLRSFQAMEQLMEHALRTHESPCGKIAGAADKGQAAYADTARTGPRVTNHFRSRKPLQPLSANARNILEPSKKASLRSNEPHANAAQHSTSRGRAAGGPDTAKRRATWRGSAAATWPCFAVQDFVAMEALMTNATKV